MSMNWKIFVSVAALVALPAPFTRAVSPVRLQAEMNKGAKVTIIDVRSTEIYQRGHIPGAINIPAAFCAIKKLPPLGRVVAYDGGIGDNLVVGAVTALNGKPGIKAETLDGGFAAWEAQRLPDTKGRGTDDNFLPMVTYQQVKTNLIDELVLVDLRKPAATSSAKGSVAQAAPLSDLRAAFPQARVSKSAFNVAGTKKSPSGDTVAPLLVLIDNGDGTALATARALRANGITRFAILAGGEQILARDGKSGSKRSGTTVTLPNLPTK